MAEKSSTRSRSADHTQDNSPIAAGAAAVAACMSAGCVVDLGLVEHRAAE